jgi:hypothetical protein
MSGDARPDADAHCGLGMADTGGGAVARINDVIDTKNLNCTPPPSQ